MAIPSEQKDSEFFSLSISPHIIVEKIVQAYVDSSIYPNIRTDINHTVGFIPSGAIYATGSIQARAHMYLTKNTDTIIYISLDEHKQEQTHISIHESIPQILGKKREQPYRHTMRQKDIYITKDNLPGAIYNQLYILRMLDHIDSIVPISVGSKIDIRILHNTVQKIIKKIPHSTIIFTAPEAIQNDTNSGGLYTIYQDYCKIYKLTKQDIIPLQTTSSVYKKYACHMAQ